MKKLFLMLLFPLSGALAQTVTLVPTNSSWKYLDNGTNQGTAWRATAFNDAAWASGNAELGYGDGDEATVVSYGPSSNNKFVTTYFRKSFSISNPASYSSLTLGIRRDDGAVVYLNGTEVARSNMPTGTISYTTRASGTVSGSGETTYYTFTPSTSLLLTGNNVLAVEIHQVNRTNPDISFNLSLTATQIATCGTPTSLTSSSITTSSATLGWLAVSGATSYNLQYRPSGNPTWTTINTAATSLNITGLSPATLYEFSVQAVCVSGNSSFSSNANFTTLSTCGTPSSLTSSSITTTSATMGWLAVSGATSYNLQYRPSGSPTWTTINTAATSLNITGLSPATLYEFSVQAVCASGNSSFSSNATFTTLTPCGTPTSLTSTSITTTSATLGWLAVNGATSYNLQYRPSGSPTWTTINTAATSLNITGLSSATLYEFSVQAVCASGNSSFSSNATFTTLTPCGTPGSLTSSSITSSTAAIGWSGVAGALNYNIRYRPVGSPTWTTINVPVIPTTISGLTAATLYEFSVQAVCASGPGSFSSNATFTTLSAPVCGTPGSLTSSSATSSSASLGWSGVAGALSYNLRYRPVGSFTWITVNVTVIPRTVSGLTPGTLYEFSVQAVCSGGPGSFSGNANFSTLITGNDSLVTTFASWKYLDNGSDQGTAWYGTSFNDGSWLSGNAELGYGDGDENTVVSFGPNSSVKYITTYFRKTITVANPAVYAFLNMSVVRDDGIVVYLNGTEVYRNNMPTGTITYTTLSPVAIGGTDESTWQSTTTIPLSNLVAGTNVIAVEMHQQAVTSSDISFKMRLWGSGTGTPPVLTRGPYLQKVTPNSITVRWRTNIASDSKVQFGGTTSYGSSVTDATLTTEHIVNLTGLSAATRYYYSVESNGTFLQGDNRNNFLTSTSTGTTAPVRVWVTGDFGNGSAAQAAVRDAYSNYTGSTPTNLWIWLGDNAYTMGTDAEYQTNVFNMYPEQFKSIPVYPSPGNHDYAQVTYQGASALTTNFPYFSIFTVPQSGEAGGVASNTPKYYSYNYSNIHFISLDSYGSLNSTSSPMYQWLNNDLAANAQQWTIVYWHHPPYTKGTHNSDTDPELINMRSNIVPLLESYHVDLVLCGHSHINERSYLIKGHFGIASSFTPSMKVSTSTNTFVKTAPFDGTVYAVCGTSGQSPGATQAGWPMPCMVFNNNTNSCSMVLDVNGDNLSAIYLTSGGNTVDQFTINKSGHRQMAPEATENVTMYHDADNNELVIDFYQEKEHRISVSFYALTGQMTETNSNSKLSIPAGFSREYLPMPELAPGLYVVKIDTGEKTYVKKIIIQ